MNKKHALRFMSISFVLLSCSSGIQNNFIPKDGFSEDPLDYTDVSRTLLTEQNYFVSYSQTSGRLGLVDADSYSEIWGTYNSKGVPHVFNLPGHEGAGLVSPGRFEVVIKEGTKQFDFPFSSSASWSRARSVIMVTAFDSATKSLAIIKYRGENVWENSTFSPFAESEVDISKSVVVAGRDGKIAVVLEPTTGSYVIYNEDSDKFSSGSNCPSVDSLVDPIKSLVLDEASGHAFAAVGKKIFQFAITPSATCSPPSLWTEVYNGDSEVVRIGSLESDRYYAVLASTQVEVFLSANGALTKQRTLEDVCVEPVSVNTFGTDALALTCAIRFSDGSKDISNAQIVVVNGSGEKIFSRSIFFEKKASIVFYPQNSKYIELYDSAVGEFDIHTVPTGEVTRLRGLFTNGILNKI